MPRRVHIQYDGRSFDLTEIQAQNEHELQEVVKSRPQLIPAEDLGLEGELLVVGRETTLASGAIDLLCLSRSGEVVLIEFKTGPQNPDFRHALAQAVDYGSDLWRMTLEDFDRGVVQRYLQSPRCDARFAGSADLRAAIARTGWDLAEGELGSLEERLTEALATGDFHYVVAAQRFTPAMKTSLDYLNATMRYGRFFLVEVVRLSGEEVVAHAAQVVAAPARRSGGAASGSPASQASEAEFLIEVVDDSFREAMRNLFAACASLGIIVTWRSKGASLQLPTPDRTAPLSIGWCFPSAEWNWQGVRHLTLGVDPASLAQTPSVATAVEKYVARVRGAPGGTPGPTRLNATMFLPEAVAPALDDILAALETLVAEALDD